jgi:hypothetical protein
MLDSSTNQQVAGPSLFAPVSNSNSGSNSSLLTSHVTASTTASNSNSGSNSSIPTSHVTTQIQVSSVSGDTKKEDKEKETELKQESQALSFGQEIKSACNAIWSVSIDEKNQTGKSVQDTVSLLLTHGSNIQTLTVFLTGTAKRWNKLAKLAVKFFHEEKKAVGEVENKVHTSLQSFLEIKQEDRWLKKNVNVLHAAAELLLPDAQRLDEEWKLGNTSALTELSRSRLFKAVEKKWDDYRLTTAFGNRFDVLLGHYNSDNLFSRAVNGRVNNRVKTEKIGHLKSQPLALVKQIYTLYIIECCTTLNELSLDEKADYGVELYLGKERDAALKYALSNFGGNTGRMQFIPLVKNVSKNDVAMLGEQKETPMLIAVGDRAFDLAFNSKTGLCRITNTYPSSLLFQPAKLGDENSSVSMCNNSIYYMSCNLTFHQGCTIKVKAMVVDNIIEDLKDQRNFYRDFKATSATSKSTIPYTTEYGYADHYYKLRYFIQIHDQHKKCFQPFDRMIEDLNIYKQYKLHLKKESQDDKEKTQAEEHQKTNST